jgi:hypothetical protein
VIHQVIIQSDDNGEFPNAALCAAYLGFKARGRDVYKMPPKFIEESQASPSRLVFGGVPIVRGYLERLGCTPDHLDYPSRLRRFLGRKFEITSLGEIRSRYNEEGPRVFIKPLQQKLFTGHEVSRFRDLIQTHSFDAKTQVYCVEFVEFISEWRFYYRQDEFVGVGHYRGDPLMFPDAETVHQALHAFCTIEDRPSACALDFGVVRDPEGFDGRGKTLLVEVNDMIALGSYGIDPRLYSELIELRWEQLVAP